MNPAIEALIVKSAKETSDFKRRHQELEVECFRLSDIFDREIRPGLRVATPKDYLSWLRGYIDSGGQPTHFYDYNMPSMFFVAITNLDIPAGYCGSLAFQVIVPIGIQVVMGWGHGNLFYLDGFKHHGTFVPVYKNTIF